MTVLNVTCVEDGVVVGTVLADYMYPRPPAAPAFMTGAPNREHGMSFTLPLQLRVGTPDPSLNLHFVT